MPFNLFFATFLRGLAQIAVSARPDSGLLILAAMALVAPWSAIGAAIGCLVGTLAAHRFRLHDEASWSLGLGGYNPAILGIFWGGALARGGPEVSLFAALLIACVLLDRPLRRLFEKASMPPMGLAAVLTGWASDWAYRLLGLEFWPHPALLPSGDAGLVVAIALCAIVLVRESVPAFFVAAILAAISALISSWALGASGLGPPGLWAFAVLPASYAPIAVFMSGTVFAVWLGVAAGLLAAAAWALWVLTPLAGMLNPLLAPCFVAIWLVLAFVGWRRGALILDPSMQYVAGILGGAREHGRPAAVLSGAGISTASGIPDYVSGAWLDPDVPVGNYAYSRFLASTICRQQYWDACDHFRDVVHAGLPNPAHQALAALEEAGFVRSVITQNVDGYHQAAGSHHVIELHGDIQGVRCIDCGRRSDWPGRQQWHDSDLTCVSCGGLLKPGVIALEENLLSGIWDLSIAALANCDVLLVVGTQVAISTAAHLLAEARRNGAQVVFVNLGPLADNVVAGDIVVNAPAETVLPALCAMVGCSLAPEATIDRPAHTQPSEPSSLCHRPA